MASADKEKLQPRGWVRIWRRKRSFWPWGSFRLSHSPIGGDAPSAKADDRHHSPKAKNPRSALATVFLYPLSCRLISWMQIDPHLLAGHGNMRSSCPLESGNHSFGKIAEDAVHA